MHYLHFTDGGYGSVECLSDVIKVMKQVNVRAGWNPHLLLPSTVMVTLFYLMHSEPFYSGAFAAFIDDFKYMGLKQSMALTLVPALRKHCVALKCLS